MLKIPTLIETLRIAFYFKENSELTIFIITGYVVLQIIVKLCFGKRKT